MKLLVVAGGGAFPIEIAKGAKREGLSVVVALIKGYGKSSSFEGFADRVEEFSIEQLPSLLSFIKREKPDMTVLAGKVPHKIIFSPRMLRPSLLPYLKRLRGKNPEAILKEVVKLIEEAGSKVVDSTLFVRHLLPEEGVLTGGRLSREEEEQIGRAFSVAKKVAELDIGLALAWKDGAVLAVEAVEGTDEMIRRAGKLSSGGFMVVKVARPQQDMRFDLPAIGASTIQVMEEAGASMLVVEAGKTLFFEREKAIERAKKAGIKVVSWRG